MVIYPAIGGIVVVVVVMEGPAMKIFSVAEEILFILFISTTNVIGSQDIKENQ